MVHHKDHLPIEIQIFETTLKSKSHMHVLGISFDSKLQWKHREQNAINKSKKALQVIYLFRKFFTKEKLLKVITSNYYSIFYYNSEIWLLPTLKPLLKQKLLSASDALLKLTTPRYDYLNSYLSLLCPMITQFRPEL